MAARVKLFNFSILWKLLFENTITHGYISFYNINTMPFARWHDFTTVLWPESFQVFLSPVNLVPIVRYKLEKTQFVQAKPWKILAVVVKWHHLAWWSLHARWLWMLDIYTFQNDNHLHPASTQLQKTLLMIILLN